MSGVLDRWLRGETLSKEESQELWESAPGWATSLVSLEGSGAFWADREPDYLKSRSLFSMLDNIDRLEEITDEGGMGVRPSWTGWTTRPGATAVKAVKGAPENAKARRSEGTPFPREGYQRLFEVFREAHDQAAYGKGAERHANNLPFHEQRMQMISRSLGSPLGMAYQVEKKIEEGLQMEDPEARRRELLGALNYLAGIVIFLDDQQRGKG